MIRSQRRLLQLGCAALSLLCGGSARGGPFEVEPYRVTITQTAKEGALEVKNTSKTVVHFHVSTTLWNQTPAGAAENTPTTDIVFFPPTFALKPGQKKTIRVGANVPFGDVEKTYRIFVMELPPEGKAEGVKTLTRMSIPIFIRPATPKVEGRIEGKVTGGHLQFRIHNSGNVRFQLNGIQVTGRGDGKQLERSLPGWYVLAQGRRDHDVPLTGEECRAAKSIAIKATSDDVTLDGVIPVDARECGP